MVRTDPIFKTQQGLKRGLDVLVTLVGLLLTWPLLIVIALAVKLDSTGPVIFHHRRIGKDGKPFSLFKFRTMVSGGDDSSYIQYLSDLIDSERQGDRKALPYRKMASDPRVTRVGKFLRTYYLDELPQAWNILKGDMSLVGPRPHVKFEVDHYNSEQRRRLTTRPGATGLWQVTGKADCTFNELIALDLEYIDQWNLWLDIKIIYMTISLLFKGGEGFWARMAKRIPQKRAKSFAPPEKEPAVSVSYVSTMQKEQEQEETQIATTPREIDLSPKPLPGNRV